MHTWLAESFDLLKPCCFVDPKITPDKVLNIPPECLISTDSTIKHQDWIPTKVSKPFPLLSEVLDHTLNSKAPKTHFDPASQHYTHSDLPFLTAQSTIFNLKKHFWHNSQKFSHSGSYAQIKTSSKVYEKITSDNEAINTDQSIPIRQMLELNKEPEEMVQPRQANNFELSDSEILRKGLHGYNAAYISLANLQSGLKARHTLLTLQKNYNLLWNYWNKFSLCIFIRKFITEFFVKISHLSNITVSLWFQWLLPRGKLFLTPKNFWIVLK